MERPSGIFWCTACKPLNTVWLIIPDSRGKSHRIVYYTRLIHSYTSTKSCSVTLRDTLRTGARIYDICIYLQWALTGEQPLKLNSRIMSQAQSPPQGSEKRCETCREMRHPIILTFIRPIPETASCSTLQFPPPSSSVLFLIVCGRRCSAMQLKHTRGWKTQLHFWTFCLYQRSNAYHCNPFQQHVQALFVGPVITTAFVAGHRAGSSL